MARREIKPESSTPEFHPKTVPSQELFSLADICRILGKSIATVHYWRLSGKIREAKRTGERGKWRVPRHEVQRLMAEQGGPEIPGLWVRPAAVLVIDDDAGVRDFVGKLFRDHAVPVELALAADVKEGLRLAKKTKPKVAVLDYFYPGKAGPDPALAAIARLGKVGDAKVIGISGDGSVGPKMIAAGAVEFLTKPVQPKTFVDAIMKHVRGKSRERIERRGAFRGMIQDTNGSAAS